MQVENEKRGIIPSNISYYSSSAGRIRTYNLLVTLTLKLLLGVDYIITPTIVGGEALPSPKSFGPVLPFRIVSEPYLIFIRSWLLIARSFKLGFPAIHLVFPHQITLEGCNNLQRVALPLSYRGILNF